MVNITEGRPTDPQPHETSAASTPSSTESLKSPNAPGAPEAAEAPGEPEVPGEPVVPNASGEPGEAGVPGEPESASARRRSSWLRRKKDPQEAAPVAPVPAVQSQEFEVAPNDPLVAYFQERDRRRRHHGAGARVAGLGRDARGRRGAGRAARRVW